MQLKSYYIWKIKGLIISMVKIDIDFHHCDLYFWRVSGDTSDNCLSEWRLMLQVA